MTKSVVAACMVFLSASFSAGALDPGALVSEIAKAVEQMDDYQVRVVSWATLDGRDERRIVDLYYREDGMLRVDVRGGTKFGDTGSVGILGEDGSVTARPGLRFLPLALTYEKHHPRVTSLRGRTIDGALIHRMLDEMRIDLARGIVTTYEETGRFVFEASYAEGQTLIVERMYFDRKRLLPERFETIEDGKRVEYVEWFHHEVGSGLPDAIFSVKYDLRDVAKLSVRTLADVPVSDDERAVLARFE